MKRILVLILILLGCRFYGQYKIQSQVVGAENGELVEMATVCLLNPRDSSLVKGVQTGQRGFFTLDKVHNGNYILVVSFVGYKNEARNVTVRGKNLFLKTIYLEEDVAMLGGVEVKGTAAKMGVRGDTNGYNAAAFKTAENAVVEELLKKMPGVEVDADGKITVNGEEITKVRVDGKKFFEDDPQMATKNIPAEMIDKIQVLDEKSEMAQLTGFEDDETERIINLTLKPNRKKGIFGNFTAGGGMDVVKGDNDVYDPRYNANVFLNMMLNDSQTSIIGGANNANQSRSGRGRSNINAGSGITNTQNLGVNTHVEPNSYLKIGGDAAANHSSNLTLSSIEKNTYSNEQDFTNYDNTRRASNNYDANMRLEMEWEIDSMNTIIVHPNISYSNSVLTSANEYTYFTEGDSVSWGNSDNYSNQMSIKGGGRMIYNHKFPKAGRTLTAHVNIDVSDDHTNGMNYSEKNVREDNVQEVIDQQVRQVSNSFRYEVRVSYVEPLFANKHFVEIAAAVNNNIRKSEKSQYSKDADGFYTQFDSVYSNNFINRFFSETMEVNYRLRDKTYDLMIGAKANPSQTYSYTTYGNADRRDVVNEVWNFSPTASFKYSFGKREFLRVMYRGTTSQPTVEQMEPSKNNSDPMNERVGNLDLKPAFNQSLRLMYSKFNQERFSSFSAGLFGQMTKDALVSNNIYDETGKKYYQTVNAADIPFSASVHVMYNTPLVQKRLHFNTRTSVSYNRRVGYTLTGLPTDTVDAENLQLGALSLNNNLGANEFLSLTFTHDVVEIGVQGKFAYSRTQNNLSTQGITHVYDWNATGNLTLHLPGQFTFASDIGYTARYGYNLSDVNELIWNASLDKTLLKNQATLSLKAYDILNQRKNIRETIGGNYVQYSVYNTLPTYVMLSFTYKLNKMGNVRMRNDGPPHPDGPHGMPGSEPPPPPPPL